MSQITASGNARGNDLARSSQGSGVMLIAGTLTTQTLWLKSVAAIFAQVFCPLLLAIATWWVTLSHDGYSLYEHS
jgi:hypothetical protein